MDQCYINRDEKGKPIKVVGAILDVSDTHKLISETQHQNKLLQEIAWEQCHVVRAPLARLKGLLQYFELEKPEACKQAVIFEKIKSSAEELDEIVKGIINRTESIEKNKRINTLYYTTN